MLEPRRSPAEIRILGAVLQGWPCHLVMADVLGDVYRWRADVVGAAANGIGGRGRPRTGPDPARSPAIRAGAGRRVGGDVGRTNPLGRLRGHQRRRRAHLATYRRHRDRPRNVPGGRHHPATLWQAQSGKIQQLARSTAGQLVRSSSSDDGETWSPAVLSGVPNNNSGISACRVDGTVYLAHNPVSGDWAARAPLILSRSDDDGATWRPPG
jgi:BNR repeat-like domain